MSADYLGLISAMSVLQKFSLRPLSSEQRERAEQRKQEELRYQQRVEQTSVMTRQRRRAAERLAAKKAGRKKASE